MAIIIHPDELVPGALPAAVTATATAGPGRALFARTSLVYRQGATFPILAIQTQDGRLGPLLGIHRGEGEAAGAAGVFVHDDVDLVHRAVLRQHVPEFVFGDIKGQVPHV